jgi:hypothetical protein
MNERGLRANRVAAAIDARSVFCVSLNAAVEAARPLGADGAERLRADDGQAVTSLLFDSIGCRLVHQAEKMA